MLSIVYIVYSIHFLSLYRYKSNENNTQNDSRDQNISTHSPFLRLTCYQSANNIIAAILCTFLYLTQTFIFDYFLKVRLGYQLVGWIVAEVVVLLLLIFNYQVSSISLKRNGNPSGVKIYSIAWITWLVMHSLTAVKVVIIFVNIDKALLKDSDQTFFWGNILKTALALSICIFITLLTTQHDAPLVTERRRYIERLCGTVLFDLLDAMDMLTILFMPKSRESINSQLFAAILILACFNLILPALSLFILNRTKFGLATTGPENVYLYQMILMFIVNIPNLLLRVVLCQWYNFAISPFVVKNMVLTINGVYEFYQQQKEKYTSKTELKKQDLISAINEMGTSKPIIDKDISFSEFDTMHRKKHLKLSNVNSFNSLKSISSV